MFGKQYLCYFIHSPNVSKILFNAFFHRIALPSVLKTSTFLARNWLWKLFIKSCNRKRFIRLYYVVSCCRNSTFLSYSSRFPTILIVRLSKFTEYVKLWGKNLLTFGQYKVVSEFQWQRWTTCNPSYFNNDPFVITRAIQEGMEFEYITVFWHINKLCYLY